MTDLFDRLFPQFSDMSEKVAVHSFRAALDDYAAGYTTRVQIISAFALDSDATADLDKLLARLDAAVGVQGTMRWLQEFESTCLLAETGLKYTTKSAFATRLSITG